MTNAEKEQLHLMALDTFLINVYNTFEYTADTTIKKLEDELADDFKVYNDLQEKEKIVLNSHDQEDPFDYLLHTQESSRIMMDMMYLTEELIALVEMKIIYAYKHLEITIKRLISLAYPETNSKDLFKADKLQKLLILKGIDVTKLNGHKEINDLRLVNNMIKHSGKIEKQVKLIPEFKDHNSVQLQPLKLFYTRVKNAPMIFLKALNVAVIHRLYP